MMEEATDVTHIWHLKKKIEKKENELTKNGKYQMNELFQKKRYFFLNRS